MCVFSLISPLCIPMMVPMNPHVVSLDTIGSCLTSIKGRDLKEIYRPPRALIGPTILARAVSRCTDLSVKSGDMSILYHSPFHCTGP